jgi:hypothetical protein
LILFRIATANTVDLQDVVLNYNGEYYPRSISIYEPSARHQILAAAVRVSLSLLPSGAASILAKAAGVIAIVTIGRNNERPWQSLSMVFTPRA